MQKRLERTAIGTAIRIETKVTSSDPRSMALRPNVPLLASISGFQEVSLKKRINPISEKACVDSLKIKRQIRKTRLVQQSVANIE